MDSVSRLDFQINRLGYRFSDIDLLSIDKDKQDLLFPRKDRPLSRLTAIGNSVLKLLASQYAIQTSEDCVTEGFLTGKKEELIEVETLQKRIGKNLILLRPNGKENADNIHSCVRMSSKVWNNATFEVPYHQFLKAIIGAVFIDAGGTSGNGVDSSMKVFLNLWKQNDAFSSSVLEMKKLKSCFLVPGGIKIFWQLNKINESYASEIEKALDFKFYNKDVLCEALIQKTFYDPVRNSPVESKLHQPDYQRLEFLGDSVLEVVIMEFMFNEHSGFQPKGLVNKMKPHVADESLRELALKLGLNKFLKAKSNFSSCANWDDYNDLMESVIGAMYVDSGIGKTRDFILKIMNLTPSVNNLTLVTYTFDDLEYKLSYKFTDQRLMEAALTHNTEKKSEDDKKRFQRFITKGRGLIELYVTDYVVRTSKPNAKYGALEAHYMYLCGEKLVRGIAGYLKLDKLVKISPSLTTLTKTPFVCYEVFVFSIFGAILDSSGINVLATAEEIFYRIWNPYLKHCPKQTLLECFSVNAEGQHQLREKLGFLIPEEGYTKIEANLGGHKFTHRCLLEQALTEREGRFYSTNANVGDSTKFEFIGESILSFFESWKGQQYDKLMAHVLQVQIRWVDPPTTWKESLNYQLLRKYYIIPPDWERMDIPTELLFHVTIAAIFIDTPGGWTEKIDKLDQMFVVCSIKKLKEDIESLSEKLKESNIQKTKPGVEHRMSTKKAERIPTGVVNPFNSSKEVQQIIPQFNNSQRAKSTLQCLTEYTGGSGNAPALPRLQNPVHTLESKNYTHPTYSQPRTMEERSKKTVPEYNLNGEEYIFARYQYEVEKEKHRTALQKLYKTEATSRSSKSQFPSTRCSVPGRSSLGNSSSKDTERFYLLESANYYDNKVLNPKRSETLSTSTSFYKTQSSSSTYPTSTAIYSGSSSSIAQSSLSATYQTAVSSNFVSSKTQSSSTYPTTVSFRTTPTGYGSAKQTSCSTSDYLSPRPTAAISANQSRPAHTSISSTQNLQSRTNYDDSYRKSEAIRREQQEMQRRVGLEYESMKKSQSSCRSATSVSNTTSNNITNRSATKRTWSQYQQEDNLPRRWNNERASNKQQGSDQSSLNSSNKKPSLLEEIVCNILAAIFIYWLIVTAWKWALSAPHQ